MAEDNKNEWMLTSARTVLIDQRSRLDEVGLFDMARYDTKNPRFRHIQFLRYRDEMTVARYWPISGRLNLYNTAGAMPCKVYFEQGLEVMLQRVTRHAQRLLKPKRKKVMKKSDSGSLPFALVYETTKALLQGGYSAPNKQLLAEAKNLVRTLLDDPDLYGREAYLQEENAEVT